MLNLPNGDMKLGGRYQIVSYLGGGGFGQTYLAQDNHLPGRPQCVVKHLKPRLSDEESLVTAHRLFETEAQVLYKLSDFPQIPRLLAHFEENQEFYLVQEFIEGENLTATLTPGNRLTEEQTIALLQEVLEVLVYLHHHHVIHRDLKPSNLIRRRRDSKIVLIDFGAVKQLSTQIQTHGHSTRTIAIGSPGYMPSEQMAGKPRFCSDLYALGMMGIQALTGLHPKSLPEDAYTSEIVWRDRAEVSPRLGDLLDKMVRYDFRERYQTALEVLADLAPLTPDRVIKLPQGSEFQPDISPETRIQMFTGFAVGSPSGSEVGIDYKHLQDLLIAQSWQVADRETHRLMLKAFDRESGQLSPDEIRQFPCRDLYLMDYLWLHHSDGLFGFSVQQDVWKSVGGTSDALYPTLEQFSRGRGKWRVNSPWQRFGSRVGWRSKEQWFSDDRLCFSLEAPKGHLPHWQTGAQVAALISRLEVCKPYVPHLDMTRKP
ncbi:GUN4 domain-containing protein [Egbenema bharatensis]|uniref:GUN4 domain-containing protein n=1 Tax=Egbenema bharatensis TaxID=3463334 RepID=UPI003A845D48